MKHYLVIALLLGLQLLSRPADSFAAQSLVIATSAFPLNGKTGNLLVSNGVPLPPGALFPGESNRVRVTVQGVEQSVSIRELPSTHKDGSLRSIIIQFNYTFTSATPIVSSIAVGPNITRSKADIAYTAVTWDEPSAVALPTEPSFLVATEIVGKTLTVNEVKAWGGSFAEYEKDFVKYGEQHYTKELDAWDYGYYDRWGTWYAWWARTGDPKYWIRGARGTADYRNNYLLPNDSQCAVWWCFVDGLEHNYLLVGNELDRSVIARIARSVDGYSAGFNYKDPRSSYLDGRVLSRIIGSLLVAWRLNIPVGSAWQNPAPTTDVRLRSYVNSIVKMQEWDGSYLNSSLDWAQFNFMTSMLNEQLSRYYDLFEADARIPPLIKKSLDYMWNTQWVNSAGSFKYSSMKMETGGSYSAPDLSNLITNTYGWYYNFSGDSSYLNKADTIFAGGVEKAFVSGHKQFNQSYKESYRYFWNRVRGTYNPNLIQTAAMTSPALPSGAIYSPMANATIGNSGLVKFKISATGDSVSTAHPSGISKIELFVDGLFVGEVASEPFEIPFDPSATSLGAHQFTIKVTSASGKTVVPPAATVSVKVGVNAQPTPVPGATPKAPTTPIAVPPLAPTVGVNPAAPVPTAITTPASPDVPVKLRGRKVKTIRLEWSSGINVKSYYLYRASVAPLKNGRKVVATAPMEWSLIAKVGPTVKNFQLRPTLKPAVYTVKVLNKGGALGSASNTVTVSERGRILSK